MDVHIAEDSLPLHVPFSEYQVLLLDTNVKKQHLLPVLPRMSSLQWIHTLLAGVEEIPFDILPDLPLTNSRGVYKNSLAEFVMFGMLYFAKQWSRVQEQQRAKVWVKFDCEELVGKTIAILSYGAIGQATALRAKAHGMKVIATRRNPSIKDEYVDEMYGPADTATVMAKADYIACCSPLTAETRLMVGAKEIDSMKKTAVFLNVGRGWVVDEPALIKALQEKRIRGAALDVFQEEPLPETSPLWGLENVLLSPHTTDNTITWKQDSARFFCDNLQRYIQGQPLENIVNKQIGY